MRAEDVQELAAEVPKVQEGVLGGFEDICVILCFVIIYSWLALYSRN